MNLFANLTVCASVVLFAGLAVARKAIPETPTAVAIHDIQGSGFTSPLSGQSVSTSGIVTARTSNGFFLQIPDASADADPNTSEGIFAFTSTTPPASAAIGNDVSVTGTVTEFVPAVDPISPSVTQLAGSITVSVNSTGNPLPAPVGITAADTAQNNLNSLEKFEGMRVQVNSLTVVAPTQGIIDEANAAAASTGVFYGVVTGVARPFREAGVQLPDPIPTPTPNPNNIPRFDANPERLRVDSDAQAGTTALEVTTGATISNLVGMLDYASRTYTILPDPFPPPSVSGNITASAVPGPTNELMIAAWNLQRFFDTSDDPGTSDAVLASTAYNNRLNKASLTIRNLLRTPEVLGVEEVENATALQDLANKINSDAVTAGQTNPGYQVRFADGNDPTGLDVGFLVKSTVSIVDVTQIGASATYINPDTSSAELLNDRPPFVLRGIVTQPSGAPLNFTAILVDQFSLNNITDSTSGNRIRVKRRAQAEYLAAYIQSRQNNDPGENLLVIGDFNAFQFNDGLVNTIGTIKGMPTPVDQVLLASSDFVNPNLTNLVETLSSDQRYSSVLDGNAAALDHGLVNTNLLALATRFVFAHANADFPESFRNDSTRAERGSDREPQVAYFHLAGPPTVVSAVSRKSSGAGQFDINLPLSGTPGVECRTGGAGGNHQVVVTFQGPVTVGGISVTSNNGQAAATFSTSGAILTINLSSVANAQTIGINLTNVTVSSSNGNIFIPMSVLLADTTGDGAVNSADISQTKAASGQAVTVVNFRRDVTVDGAINSGDISLVKSRSGTSL